VTNMSRILREVVTYLCTTGNPYLFKLGDYNVITYDPDLIKQVMVTESYKYNRPEIVKRMVPGISNGLFGSSGKQHARQRKLINPAFSFTTLKCFVPTFVESSANLVQVINIYIHLFRKGCLVHCFFL
jgi:cytochrome P450